MRIKKIHHFLNLKEYIMYNKTFVKIGSTVIAGCLNDDSLYYSEDNGKTWKQSNIK